MEQIEDVELVGCDQLHGLQVPNGALHRFGRIGEDDQNLARGGNVKSPQSIDDLFGLRSRQRGGEILHHHEILNTRHEGGTKG